MVLLWKRKVDESKSKSVFFNPRIDQNNWRDNDDWFHNIYDSWKDNDSQKDYDWLFKERLKLKLKDNHSKNWELEDWFWMESWKLEDSWKDNQINLRKSTHRAHIHETLKNSRIPVYTRIRMRYFFKFLS